MNDRQDPYDPYAAQEQQLVGYDAYGRPVYGRVPAHPVQQPAPAAQQQYEQSYEQQQYGYDYVDIVVHVQHSEERVFYALERLWRTAREIELPEDAKLTIGKAEEHAKLREAAGDDELDG
ncbi:RsfS/YbeB/iojap family protein [Streptomyces avidinii]